MNVVTKESYEQEIKDTIINDSLLEFDIIDENDQEYIEIDTIEDTVKSFLMTKSIRISL